MARAHFMRRPLVSRLGSLLVAWSLPLHAQEPPAAAPESATEAQRAEEDRARLVKDLLTSDADAEDMAWLYSNADEYTPSGLTGEPLVAPGLPERGEGTPRTWDPRWRKFGTANYVLTAVGFGAAGASLFVPVPDQPWRGKNSFDEWGRRTFTAPSYEKGHWARDTSDVLLSLTVAFPLLVDSLIVAQWYRRSPEVAGQMALITVETIAVSSMLQGIVSAAFARERPYGRECGGELPDDLNECMTRDRYRSFYSGHTSASFAAAAVTCTHHAVHDLFGDPFADGLTCGVMLGSAATVGFMRVVGMKHYLTDVASGALAGTLGGLAVPWLLHYGPLARVQTESAVRWSVVPLGTGLAVGGTF